jgi:DNA mismatch repair ATPase MutS
MKAFLMHKNKDLDINQKLPSNEQALTQDLELNILFNAMAAEDRFLFEVAKKTILAGSNNEIETIKYRQNILKDCLKNPAIVREIYQIPIESIESKKKYWYGFFGTEPSGILYNAIKTMQVYIDFLKKLKNISDKYADKFTSDGFKKFFSTIKKELDDEYITSVQNQLKELEFRKGTLISADLGKGNTGVNYILRKPKDKNQSWIKQVFTQKHPVYTFHISERDDSGAKTLLELVNRGVNLAANSLAQSVDHIESFFEMLRVELAFYIGCLNLYEKLTQIEAPVSFPVPEDTNERRHSFKGLYDVCLTLTRKQKIVSNNLNAESKEAFIITGANEGGKTVFLRSIGLAQLMMQCGMFVAAESFNTNICSGIFTHYKRKEDPSMKSGKLDEELSRMNEIVNNIKANSIILFNESFAATNERDGSEIARQIIYALLEKRIKVFFVTHLCEFAQSFHDKNTGIAIFLRAERKPDGKRTFKIIEGKPLDTSYGKDLYNGIFLTNK